VHPPDRTKKKKLKKEHYTGGQDLQILLKSTEWRCKSYSFHMSEERIFGLGWLVWACYLEGVEFH
jgi:hypothetical protein